ncbi:Glucanosyltransferase-domain-containing protein [Sphaerosporella brunnea]|uniref:1,3-beta-glucanosyltransferase n=1 Tax=Sphaerosporella brunnea TaxID=1250544 RepID=A0A5J5EXJ6_9PEZI|nr:Glucanosyltransferase-domain-containing protein [Sphaerosporella brunnea]
MKFTLAATAVAASLINFAAAADLDPIVIKGNKFFFKSNGTQFFIKGVAYQASTSDSTTSTYVDPLADETSCKRDIPYLQELGTNTIRVYAVDPTKSHDVCMKLLNDAGIYVVSDLSEPANSINRNTPQWDDSVYTRYTAVVDALQGYSNVLGFFAGNEVSNQANNTDASAYVKAAVRDVKSYIKAKNYRDIPVGYATNDDADIRVDLANYFDCNSAEESVDFWGYNIYSWCGDSSFTKSGYDVRTEQFKNYSVPAFFAEYGCNLVQPRKFSEVKAIYGSQMTDVWSGGIVYMYFQEANDYGLVSVSGNNVKTLADFNNLKTQLASATPTGVKMATFTPTNTALQDCPAEGTAWMASPTLPPTPNKELCSCMVSSLSCVAKSSLPEKNYADLFSYICGGNTDCSGINGNATTGKYGAYSMCNSTERLSWAMNAYYDSQNKASTACDFSGSGTTQAAASSSGSCSALMKEAGGISGTGTVTSQPSATGSGSGSASAGNYLGAPSVNVGALKIGSAMAIAFLSGFAVLLV